MATPNQSRTISFVGDDEMRAWLDQEATSENRRLSDYMRTLINDYRQWNDLLGPFATAQHRTVNGLISQIVAEYVARKIKEVA